MTSLPADVQELTIGELAGRSGVRASALRFYERQGLIRSRRTAGNQRRYRRETLRRVAFIRASHHLGIPLSVIGDVLALLPEGVAPTREFWERASHCWSEEIDARIARLERMRDRFTECIGCGCLSFDQCALVNPGDRLGAHGPGPRRLFTPEDAPEDVR
ncbi:redox-sensitive transcriptional activator SoxR [Actinomadura viridis]|uniref:MerR family redox-sensitive transcriptional activator SoxR n=1 Tax=Actinomadura viridis TaxID=58110 RepID=A0A931DU52_9ACTN|nr:redox-sensitive transcriptional activator SoxR [Actinomadura viridis]MBG6093615.1 MerR family redox-sensitive transcriptional activator SoxR [Actinomadura viridis]